MNLPFIFYIYLLIQCSTALVGGFYYKNLPRPLRSLEWLIIIGVVDIGLQWLLAVFHIHSSWTTHFYTLIELAFVFLIYLFWMKQDRSRMVLQVCFLGFIILWIVSKFTFESLSFTDDGTASISKILQIVFSVYLLMDIVKGNDLLWTRDPRLWVIVSILIYAAGSLFWFALYNKMLQDSPERLIQVYSLNWILMIISNLLFLRAFLCTK